MLSSVLSLIFLPQVVGGARALANTIPPPILPREFRGVWVASVDNIDWPSKRTFATEEARAELVKLVDQADRFGFNAILFQVRPSADALYLSGLEPWSEFLTGAQGTTPKPFWDPLEECIRLAHANGIEVHAWINPFRAWHPAAKGQPSPDWVGSRHPNWVKTYGNLKWLDPGIPEARDFSLLVIQDIVRRYNVDGMHIDDYFYPYPVKGQEFPDEVEYQSYRTHGGTLDKQGWRRQNVDIFVDQMNSDIHLIKPWVKVGISPFGIYRPGTPKGIQAGVDQYADMGSDPVKWLEKGWCDYLSPQLYWKISTPAQSYPVLLKWWQSVNVKQRHLWPGLYSSRLLDSSWEPKEITDQIELTRKEKLPTQGHVHFSFKVFAKDAKQINTAMAPLYAKPAVVPDSPWLGRQSPTKPSLRQSGRTVSWAAPSRPLLDQILGQWDGKTWEFRKLGPTATTAELDPNAKAVTIFAVGFGSSAIQGNVLRLVP